MTQQPEDRIPLYPQHRLYLSSQRIGPLISQRQLRFSSQRIGSLISPACLLTQLQSSFLPPRSRLSLLSATVRSIEMQLQLLCMIILYEHRITIVYTCCMILDLTSHATYKPYMILCLSNVIIINKTLYYKIISTYLALYALTYLVTAHSTK